MAEEFYGQLGELIKDCQSQKWQLKKWKAQPALIEKSGRFIQYYYGQKYDFGKFELVEDAWDHDHCEFCNITISNCEHKNCIHEAYESADHCWVCPDCYRHLVISREDPETYLKNKWKN